MYVLLPFGNDPPVFQAALRRASFDPQKWFTRASKIGRQHSREKKGVSIIRLLTANAIRVLRRVQCASTFGGGVSCSIDLRLACSSLFWGWSRRTRGVRASKGGLSKSGRLRRIEKGWRGSTRRDPNILCFLPSSVPKKTHLSFELNPLPPSPPMRLCSHYLKQTIPNLC